MTLPLIFTYPKSVTSRLSHPCDKIPDSSNLGDTDDLFLPHTVGRSGWGHDGGNAWFGFLIWQARKREDQAEPECCGSNEKCCHAHGHLTSWLPECGSLWGGLGGTALLKEMCHWDLLSSCLSLATMVPYCLSYGFHGYNEEPWPTTSWGRKGLCSSHFYIAAYRWRKSGQEFKIRQAPWGRMGCRDHGGILLIDLFFMTFLACLLTEPQTTSPEWPHPQWAEPFPIYH